MGNSAECAYCKAEQGERFVVLSCIYSVVELAVPLDAVLGGGCRDLERVVSVVQNV